MFRTSVIIWGLTIAVLCAAGASAAPMHAQPGDKINVGVGMGYETWVDIDGDGLTDVVFEADFDGDGNGRLLDYVEVWGENGTVLNAGPLVWGDTIGPDLVFRSFGTLGYYYSDTAYYANNPDISGTPTEYYSGSWTPHDSGYVRGYLGLRLGSGSYGWIELEIDLDQNAEGVPDARAGTIFAFGHDARPGVAMLAGGVAGGAAPVPVSSSVVFAGLGMGAFGAMARAARNRRLKAAAKSSKGGAGSVTFGKDSSPWPRS